MTNKGNSPKIASAVMRTVVFTLKTDSTLKQAWELFKDHNISGAPVVNEAGELVGVLSQHDLARRALSSDQATFGQPSFYYMLPTIAEDLIPVEESKFRMLETPVEEIMNPYVVTVGPDDSVSSVAATLKSHHIHRVIVAQGKKILGIISTFDLLDLI